MVTIRCGHCTDLFSVDMMRASFIPIKLLVSLGDEEQKQDQLETKLPKSNDGSSHHMINGDEGEEDMNEFLGGYIFHNQLPRSDVPIQRPS
ncbi:hypothetical protein QJS10_CPA05g00243 [Acorus calamus]|uniref:YABBY N-terminal domain-containing protein n=1 Tax=Acorus calamus TaxID=4465 RepID=A0AAV9EUY0_ACOCL|nr:hypothetical protein QJS10_CPA05g00243 [Acorus calamus]